MSLEILSADVLERSPPAQDWPSEETPPPMTEAAFTSDFLKVLQERGYIHQVTHPAELDEA